MGPIDIYGIFILIGVVCGALAYIYVAWRG